MKKKKFSWLISFIWKDKNSGNKKELNALATKSELKGGQDKIVKLQTSDLSYYRDKSHFEDNDTQNYLCCQSVFRWFKRIGNRECISAWKTKGLLKY